MDNPNLIQEENVYPDPYENQPTLPPKSPPPGRQPQKEGSLLKILGSSILVSLLLMFALVYFYGRNYRPADIHQVLASPKTLMELSFKDIDPETNKRVAFMVDKIEYHVTPLGADKYAQVVPYDLYGVIYGSLKNDENIEPNTELVKRFNEEGSYSSMLIRVKPQERVGNVTYEGPIFQEIQFLTDSNYYRVSARQASRNKEWVYFKHKNPMMNILNRFKP